MIKLIMALSMFSFHTYAKSKCENFFDKKATEVGLGTFGDNDLESKPLYEYKPGVYPQKMSKTSRASKRRSNHGPSIVVRQKENEFHIMQLFEHDGTVEKYRRYNYVLSQNCNEVLEVKYTTSNHEKNGHIVLLINKEKCKTPKDSFLEFELGFVDFDKISIQKLCLQHYPEKSHTSGSLPEESKSLNNKVEEK